MVRHRFIRRLTTIAALVVVLHLPSTATVAAIGDDNTATSTPSLRGVDYALVLDIQQRLKQLGIYLGLLDGRLTEETEAAVRFYQRQSGLFIDGIVTRALLEHLNIAAIKAGRLLLRVEEARKEQTVAARLALDNHTAARDLLAAIPTASLRTSAQAASEDSCLEAPRPDCLLNEALKAALASRKRHFRDGAFRDVAIAWTAAGDATAGIAAAKRMSDPRLLIVVLGRIARAQAVDGDYEGAHTTALAVPDPRVRAEALSAIAAVQISSDRVGAARDTLSEVLDATSRIAQPLWRTTLECEVVVLRAKLGDTSLANEMLEQALERARGIDENFARNNALARVAAAQAELGRLDDALITAASIDEARHRVPVLIKVAQSYAESGQFVSALETSAAIEDALYRVTALISIAQAQASDGDVGTARATLASARMAGREIARDYSRAFALSRIARSQASIGAIDDARETAGEVEHETLRAQALWAIAASPARHCDSAAACEDETLAFAATRKIKNVLERITLLADVAVTHSLAGNRGKANTFFDEALTYAVDLVTPWVRARAFSRLATTLSVIR